MGAKLVQWVSDEWGHLPPGPYKVLVRIAAYSLDDTQSPDRPAGHYWRGWAHLAEGLGRKPPHDDDRTPEAERRRKTIQDELRRHTSKLVALGAIHRAVDNPGKGTRQVWVIHR